MATGFALRRLEVTGPGKEPALISFGDGLNVISGPSDTGKTYIVQCVEFCLGAGDPPEAIDAAIGYTRVALTIEGRRDGVLRTLSRALQGGALELSVEGQEPRELAATHRQDDTKTASGYLLELCGLLGHRVRYTAHGATRGISFRDIAHLTIVDEGEVMDPSSPSRSPHGRDATVEDRVFRFVLTGEDDSAVVADPDPKKVRQQRTGRAELIEELLAEVDLVRGEAPVRVDDASIAERQVAELDEQIRRDTEALASEQETAETAEARRRPAWERVRAIESRLEVLRELQSRFELLRAQYASDVRRLIAIIEAGGRLQELDDERCAICGALAVHHDREHARALPAPGEIVGASQAEMEKIQRLARDLNDTIADNTDEIGRLEADLEAGSAALAEIEAGIDAHMRPRLARLSRAVRLGERDRGRLVAGLELKRRESQLRGWLGDARRPVPSGTFKAVLAGPTSGEAEEFAQCVEAQLRAWNFPDLQRVTFSDETQDIVVSGQQRRSRGKGVRALTHAAFTLGLLRLSLDKTRTLPGLAVIDSPLVVYEEPDPGEDGFPADVKDEFYRNVAKDFADAQVVILENGAPPQEIAGHASLVHFTKSDHGRYGFIPT